MKNLPLLVFFFWIIPFLSIKSQNLSQKNKLDSINFLRKLSIDADVELEDQFAYAYRAYELSEELDIDSTRLRSNEFLSNVYYRMDKYELFKNINIINLELAEKLKDTVILANTNYNLGLYYHNELLNDSAYYYYYKSSKYYYRLKKFDNRLSYALINIADIQETERDYVESEKNAVTAIEIIETLPQTDDTLNRLWILYNLLGVISGKLESYTEAIINHNKGYEISKKMNNGKFNGLYSINNKAFIYRLIGDNKKAIELYKKILNTNDLFNDDPAFYALILENLAYTRFIYGDKEYDDLERLFKKAYKISDSLDDVITKMAVTIDISKFYNKLNKSELAFYYAKETYDNAKEIKSNDIVLESLMLMSKIKEGSESINYLNEHIILKDSLLHHERSIRNKFAKIRFNTDQLKKENAQISKERLLFLLLSVGLMLSLTLLYIVISQRSRNKELQFKQEQQEANEEIYNLMLAQQDKIEEGRTKEKKRISQELHDGVLGRLFGTRLNLDSLNMVNTDEAIKNREQYIDELKVIEQEIRKISHDLNTDFIRSSTFIDIVKNLIKTQTKAYHLDYHFKTDETINWDKFSNKNKINLYRILQECMQNIYKHAKAKSMNIGIALKNNVILMSVEDNGIGFNTDKVKEGIGIKNINSRAEEIGGKIEINSIIGQGTNMVISIPIK